MHYPLFQISNGKSSNFVVQVYDRYFNFDFGWWRTKYDFDPDDFGVGIEHKLYANETATKTKYEVKLSRDLVKTLKPKQFQGLPKLFVVLEDLLKAAAPLNQDGGFSISTNGDYK